MTPSKRWLITLAVMTVTLIEVLDITIANVVLPNMQGSLGATMDEITWVLTSYLVASAILMPLTGYFTDVLGRKKYLLICIGGFAITSALCGMAENLTQIVIFRAFQGALGGALVPLSQAILVDIFPEDERGKAMAIWGIGVMIGPILGPTLGGYLTELINWRWNFFINIPVGIFSFILSMAVVPDTLKKQRSMNWIGLILMSISIASLQYFLDRGNQDDWFNSTGICVAGFCALVGFLSYMLYDTYHPNNNVFKLAIFKDRNFILCSVLIGVLCLGLYGAMMMLPIMLESLFNYPVLTTGLAMAPRGITGMLSMIMVGQLINRTDPRNLIMVGSLICAASMFVCTNYNLDISLGWILGPIFLQGLGMGLIFVPLSAIAFLTLPAEDRAEAAGLFSLLRTIGSSMGISIVATLFARHTQIAWNQLSGHIQTYSPAYHQYLQSIHLKAGDPKATAILAHTLGTQAQMVSFVDAFYFMGWSFIVMLPLVFLIKRPRETLTMQVE